MECKGVNAMGAPRAQNQKQSQKKQKLHELVDRLSPEQLEVAEVLLEGVLAQGRVTSQEGQLLVKLGGLWKDRGLDLSEEEFSEIRRELWGALSSDSDQADGQ